MPLLGQHTIDETTDFVRAQDSTIASLKAARAKVASDWSPQWDSDFSALLSRWAVAKAEFIAEAATVNAVNPLVPTSILTTETAYQALLKAVQPTLDTVTPGDLQDLFDRLKTATPITENVPQPTATDPDNTVLTAIPKPPKLPSATTVKWGLIAMGAGAALVGGLALKTYISAINPFHSRKSST